MNEIQIFDNKEFGEVRVIDIDGEPWLVGMDIADRLEYQNGSRDINRHVDEEDRQIVTISCGVQDRKVTVINESGLYAMVLSSKMPKAKKFKRWVTSDVLPSIRKTGAYNIPQTYAEALRAYADAVEQKERLALENKALQPKAEFFDAVTDSKDAISMADVAKVLDMGIGRNKLFGYLREKKILMSDNKPYQEYIDRGYFRVIEQKFDRGYGEASINFKTLVFQKGVDHIRKMLQEDGYGR